MTARIGRRRVVASRHELAIVGHACGQLRTIRIQRQLRSGLYFGHVCVSPRGGCREASTVYGIRRVGRAAQSADG
jgi:hypothetical protein